MYSKYILAGYPLLWIETFEEYRAMTKFCADLKSKAKEDYQMFTWDCADGVSVLQLKKGTLQQSLLDNDIPLNDPITFLDWAKEEVKENSIFFLKDFHHFTGEDSKAGPIVCRKIRNMIPAFKATGRCLVILSPVVKIPTDIEKEITVIPFKLPDRNELGTVLKSICETASAKKPEDIETVINSALGMTSFEAENAFSVSLIEKSCICSEVVQREKAAIVKKTQMLEVMEPVYNQNDIGALENVKEWLGSRTNCFTDEAKKFGITPPRGMLLVGISGCGKSLIAKTTGVILNRPVLRLNISKIYGSYVGDSESNIARVLAIAEAVAPCVLFIDEFEKAFPNLKGDGSHETSKRVFASFLTWMQDRTADVFIMATANNVDGLPPETLRSGRWDCMFFVDLPDPIQCEDILSIHLRLAHRDINKVIKSNKSEIIKALKGFSGAEIEAVVKESLVRSFSQNLEDVNEKVLLETIKDFTPLSKLMEKDIDKTRKWAETRRVKNASIVHKQTENITSGRKIACQR